MNNEQTDRKEMVSQYVSNADNLAITDKIIALLLNMEKQHNNSLYTLLRSLELQYSTASELEIFSKEQWQISRPRA